MTGINGKRVLLAGFVAAIVITVFEIGAEPILGAAWIEQLQRLGLPEPGEAAILATLPAALLLGLTGMWIYAVAIPRLGANRETACLMGIALWVVACFAPNLVMWGFGILSTQLAATASVIGLVQLPVAMLAGSFVYKEVSAADTRRVVGKVA